MDLGGWQGLTFAEVAAVWPEAHRHFWDEPSAYCSPAGGESFADLRARADAALATIVEANPVGDVLVVTHSLVIKAFWLVVTHRPVADFWATAEFGPGGLTVLHADAGEMAFHVLNDMTHLEPVEAAKGSSS
jgi:probable phosphoglycerate mutase